MLVRRLRHGSRVGDGVVAHPETEDAFLLASVCGMNLVECRICVALLKKRGCINLNLARAEPAKY